MKTEYFDLKNKRALVSGGASGIGSSIVENLCEQGVEVYFFDINKNEAKEISINMLQRVGIADAEKRFNQYAFELSGCMRQRAMIAMALSTMPKLLLADEPVASLDPKAANLILSLLKKINKEFGTTILCNLHQVDLAKKYSDRLVGLLDGKIIFDEKSENINKSNLEKIYV